MFDIISTMNNEVEFAVSVYNLLGLTWMDCILGMEFITYNKMLIEGHNRLVKISSKNGVIWVKAHEVPSVGGSTIHLMLGNNLEKECMGSYGMLCDAGVG